MYTFIKALANCKPEEKIIYGTRSEKFHLIDSSDRDYNTGYSSTKEEAQELGEVNTVLKSIGR
jgi:hypothetical protein